jgi:hypothetical protein
MNFRGGNGGGGRPTNPGSMDLIEDNMNKSTIYPTLTSYRYHGKDQHIEQVGRIHQEDKHEHQ